MQFPFEISQYLQPDAQGVCKLEGTHIKGNYMGFGGSNARYGGVRVSPLGSIIDLMGNLSAKSQKLPTTITTIGKFAGSNHRLYFLLDEHLVVGFIKIGEKNIFYRDIYGSIKELYMTSVLDFYIHESCQRKGFGKKLFERMIYYEKKEPEEFAIDRPSTKFKEFLSKHYNLKSFVPQNNHYVIFDRYFDIRKSSSSKKSDKTKNHYSLKSEKHLPNRPPRGYTLTAENVMKGGYGYGVKKQANDYKHSNNYDLEALEYISHITSSSKIKKTENEIDLVRERLGGKLPSIPRLKSYYQAPVMQPQQRMPWATHHIGLGKNSDILSSYGGNYTFNKPYY